MITLRKLATVTLLGLLSPVALDAQDHAGHHADATAEVTAVVEGFHAALADGDTTTLRSLLADDVRILEGGGIETLEEYASHHMGADVAFAQAVPRERGPLHVVVSGVIAWVASTSRAVGTYRDREIDSSGGELMVLSRTDDGTWLIRSISWS